MSKYYSINEFSKILGVSAQTLRNWDTNGKLHPHHTSSNGYRYYSHEQLNQVMNRDQEYSDVKLDNIYLNTIIALSDLYYDCVGSKTKNIIDSIKNLIGGDEDVEINKSNVISKQQTKY